MYKYLLLSTAILAISTSRAAEDFQTDRLPIGAPDRKYDFCSVKLNKILNTHINKEASFQEMIENLKQKRIVLLGETHTNQLHHDVQFEIIKGLIEAGKPVVLALEMFNPAQNEVLADWSSGKTDANTFMEQTDFLTTWSHNYRYYKAIFDFVREHHIPMYGANVERKYASKIGKKGITGLTEDELKAIPEVDTANIEHRFYIKVAMQGMDASMPQIFPNIYQAQCLWDTAMGEGAIKAAVKHPDATVVVLAGSGHVDYNLGIGRIIEARSDLSFASVVAVDVEKEQEDSGMVMVKKSLKEKKPMEMNHKTVIKKTEDQKTTSESEPEPPSAHSMGMMNMDATPDRIVSRSLADYLWGKEEMEKELYPAFGFSFEKDVSNGYTLKRIFPETIAFENGFKPGDIIQSLDGKTFPSLFELKKHLQYKNWEETLEVSFKRDDKVEEISFVIQPVEED